MKLTYYGYQPFDVDVGRVTVLATGAPKIYRELLDGLRNDAETIHVADDQFNLLTMTKACQWYGDPLLEINLNALFQRKLQTQLLHVLSDEQTVQLTDDLRQLLTQVLENSYLLDVPLNLPEMPVLSKLVKFSGLKIDGFVNESPHGILETLVKVLVELNDQRTIVLTNVSHYLQVSQLQELVQVVADANLPVLIIEYSETRQNDYFQKCDYHYIDSDFVLW